MASALAAVFAYVPTSQVLLGSDYPFGTSTDGIRGLEEYGLKPSLGRRAASRLMLEIDVGERLTVGVADDEAGVGFLGGPGRREAAGRHFRSAARSKIWRT
jgi:hypothetical protein